VLAFVADVVAGLTSACVDGVVDAVIIRVAASRSFPYLIVAIAMMALLRSSKYELTINGPS
jgi:ABC-type dipeptide/oligopeptide/nickel transport system permease subunit